MSRLKGYLERRQAERTERLLNKLERYTTIHMNLVRMTMSRTIYEVNYYEIIDGDEEFPCTCSKKVLANGDAREAIAIVEKDSVGREWEWEDDEGEKQQSKVTGFGLIGIRKLATADLP